MAFGDVLLRNILKDGSGDNADINFVLINMLNDAGVKAVPVVMSTRDNGRLPLTYPSRKFLNTFVVGAYTMIPTMVFIDSSIDDGYLNVLPAKLLTDRARIIEKIIVDGLTCREYSTSQRDIRISASLILRGIDGYG